MPQDALCGVAGCILCTRSVEPQLGTEGWCYYGLDTEGQFMDWALRGGLRTEYLGVVYGLGIEGWQMDWILSCHLWTGH